MASPDIVRIFISGPHSTGKTTLVQALKPHLSGFKAIENIGRAIIEMNGWSPQDYSPDSNIGNMQKLFEANLQRRIELDVEYTGKGFDYISDRGVCPLVYIRYFVGKPQRDLLCQRADIQGWLDRMRQSLVFLVKPQPECILDDNVRFCCTLEELNDFYSAFEEELSENDINYHVIKELSLDVRVETVLSKLKDVRESKLHAAVTPLTL